MGQIVVLVNDVVVGRASDADLILRDAISSRYHAKVSMDQEDTYTVEDLKSLNGTFLNGKKITRNPLNNNDVIDIGTTQIQFFSDDPPWEQFKDNKDDGKVMPRVMKPIDTSLTGPSLDELPIENFFQQLGISNLDMGQITRDPRLEEILRTSQRFAILFEVSKLLQSPLDLDKRLEKTLDIIMKISKAQRGYLIQIGEANVDFKPRVIRHTDSSGGESTAQFSKTVIEWVIRSRSAIMSMDVGSDERIERGRSILAFDIRSVICVPLTSRNRVVAVFYVDNPLRLREFKEKDLDLITIIGGVCSMAVENAELYKEQERIIQELRTAKEHLEKAQENRVEKEKNLNEIERQR
jgi:pSer/pThr/pTyr-binding forkhead associated (FHA) protein